MEGKIASRQLLRGKSWPLVLRYCIQILFQPHPEVLFIAAHPEYVGAHFGVLFCDGRGRCVAAAGFSQPMADVSTFEIGKVRKGTKVEAVFGISNLGKSTLRIHKVDTDTPHASVAPFADLKPGEKGSLKVSLDTAEMPSGEVLVLLSLITNSPLRPIMNLYVTGWIE